MLIFDDLTQQNYEMIYHCLDVDDIQIIVDRIAKYHALSLILVDRVRDFWQFSKYRARQKI